MSSKHDYQQVNVEEMDITRDPEKSSAQVVVSASEVDQPLRNPSLSRHDTDHEDWKTGVRERFPWWGFLALITALACSAGSFLVLHFSDGTSATRWPNLIAPNVCLSILGSVSTIAITYAIGEGIAIAWWRRAMDGASVKELHNAWSFSASVTSIVTQLKSFNVIALAALMAKLSIVDGVLYQRATYTYLDIDWHASPASIEAWVSDKFPVTGTMGYNNDTDFNVRSTMAWVIDEFYSTQNSPLFSDRAVKGCWGVGCTYALAGMGFSVDCEYNTITDDTVNTAPLNSSGRDVTMFSVNVNMLYPDEAKNYSRLQLVTKAPYLDLEALDSGIEVEPSCPTNFTITTCELRPAVLNYTTWFIQANNVEESRVEGVIKAEADPYARTPSRQNQIYSASLGASGSTLGYSCGSIEANVAGVESASDEVGLCYVYDQPSRQIAGVQLLNNVDIHEPWIPGSNSSLLGIYQTLKNTLESDATISYRDGIWSESTTGILPGTHRNSAPTDGSCLYEYEDPVNSAVNLVNIFTRIVSVSQRLYEEDAVTQYNTKTNGVQFYRDIYHATDIKYAIAALACTVIVVIMVIPVYWGFWHLGRDVTMGPLEIAYAFQGPAFAGVNDANGNVGDLVKAVGDTRIKYAAVSDGVGTKLAFKTT